MNRQQQIGQKIRSARLEARLTQEELGKKIGYSAMGVSYLENGTRSIKLADLTTIAEILKVTESYLLDTIGSQSNLAVDYSRAGTEDGNRDQEALDALKKFKEHIQGK